MKKKLIITAALALMAGGLWWQFVGSNKDSATTDLDSSTTTTAAPGSEEFEDYYDQEDPTNPTATKGDSEPRNVTPEKDLDRCIPEQNGFGIEMKNWGDVRLPYADNWPKNEPGTPIDCAPDSDFGAAVVAAHYLFVEDLAPEYIPDIALDTPARQERIENHSGGLDPYDLGMVCQPLGWDRPTPGIYVWLIYFQCGDGPVNVTSVRMQNDYGPWLMVYHFTGQIDINEAEPDTAYYPFEGGD